MPLCTPDIQGPVSVLSTDIRVTGQLSGATVRISSIGQNPRLIAHGVASSGDQRFPLDTGVILDAKDQLIAIQSMGSETSPPTPADFAVAVQPLPQSASEVSPVAFETHLYECGQYVWISGAVPGAPVKVLDQANQNFVYGSGFSQEGDAHLTLKTVLPSSKTVLGAQELPNLQGLTPTPATADALPPGARPSPAPPVMAPPLLACQPSVLVSAVYDGATVTLDHKGGESDVYDFDTDTAWAILPNPLTAGDTLASRQDFIGPAAGGGCNIRGQELSPPMPVGPAQSPSTPVLGPICAGTTKIPVANLAPGALVTLTVDGEPWLGQVPPDAISYSFTVDPVKGGQVKAKQTLCGIDSGEALASVDPHEVITVPPTLLDPCTLVRVRSS